MKKKNKKNAEETQFTFDIFKIRSTLYCKEANEEGKIITIYSNNGKPNYQIVGYNSLPPQRKIGKKQYLPIGASTLRNSSAAVRAMLHYMGVECLYEMKGKPLAILLRHPDYVNATFEDLRMTAIDRGLLPSGIGAKPIQSDLELKVENLEKRLIRLEKVGGR